MQCLPVYIFRFSYYDDTEYQTTNDVFKERSFSWKSSANSSVPFDLSSYPCRKIEQGYLSTAPVVRIRRDNNDYILTYKSKGMMIREEYNLPLTKESYEHLKEKIDGRLITKKRYVIPLKDFLFIELDIFSGDLAPLMLAEVEFPDEETANHFTPPEWFGEDVTFSSSYHNSTLSKL